MRTAEDEDDLGLLTGPPTRAMNRRLVRCVPALGFLASSRASFLFTSGRPGRCNPRGVECLYFSETEATADVEYRRPFAGTPAADQPKLVFRARVALRRILDLADRAVRTKAGLASADLASPWRLAPAPTRLQGLGLEASRRRRITAIRFPSAAARAAGHSGWNVAIFPPAVSSPDRVEILGPEGKALKALP